MQKFEKMTLDDVGSFLIKLAENSDSVYWLSTPDFNSIQYISPAYEKIWGRSREELYTNPKLWITYLHESDRVVRHPIQEMAEKVAKYGVDARYEELYRIVRPDGSIRWIFDKGFPIYLETGKCCGVTGVAIDVTIQKEMEKILQEAKLKAELTHQLKTEFIRNMEHDIRTPFNGILSLSNLLLEQETDPVKKEMLVDITGSAKELLDYCDGILDFSQIEEGVIEQEIKQFNVAKLVKSVMKIEAIPAKSKCIDLSSEIGEELFQDHLGDEFRIKRILINLISNAIKFTNRGSVNVKLHLCQEQLQAGHSTLQIVIEDTGIGICDSKKNLIFERFVRGVPSENGLYPGQGLGLSIVKKFINDLKGVINLSTELGIGSKFTVLLPIRRVTQNE